MLKYAASRVVVMIPMLFVVLFITFTMGYYGPLDPVKLRARDMINQGFLVTDEDMALWRHQFGLDRPLLVQYGAYLGRIVRGDLGTSMVSTTTPVSHMISISLPTTLKLALGTSILLALVGIPLGLIAALRHNTAADYAIVGTSLFLHAVPVYVMGPVLMVVLVLYLHAMSVPRGFQGFHPSTVLFIFLLSMHPLAVVVRQTRAGILEVLSNDYVRTARAKGLRPMTIFTRHILKNALIPVVTSLGTMISGFVTGTVFLDTMFNIAGFGRLFSTALSGRDFPVIYGSVITIAAITMIVNLVVDLVYPLLDPRVTYK